MVRERKWQNVIKEGLRLIKKWTLTAGLQWNISTGLLYESQTSTSFFSASLQKEHTPRTIKCNLSYHIASYHVGLGIGIRYLWGIDQNHPVTRIFSGRYVHLILCVPRSRKFSICMILLAANHFFCFMQLVIDLWHNHIKCIKCGRIISRMLPLT